MIPIILRETYRPYTPPAPEGCVNEGARKLDGTGPHLGLQSPWWNDLSHDITDSSIFRILLIIMVLDYIYGALR